MDGSLAMDGLDLLISRSLGSFKMLELLEKYMNFASSLGWKGNGSSSEGLSFELA